MHLQTHLMSGWCIGNLLPLGPRERLFCMIAAAAPDVDGVVRVFGEEAYWNYHHVVGHNLAFAIVTSVMLATLSTRRRRLLTFAACVALVHLHLLLDYYGSGPGWGIPYFWPFERRVYLSPHVWAFYSWQNLSAAAVMLAWTIWIVDRDGRTPLEAIMPSLDRQLAQAWDHRIRRRRKAPTQSPAPEPPTARPA